MLWYPPRERTLKLDAELERLGDAPGEDLTGDEGFLVRISACIRYLAVNTVLPPSYIRDWLWIGSQFRIHASSENQVFQLARRALLFLEQSLNADGLKGDDLRQDLTWVTDGTISNLRAELGPNEYSSFLSLSDAEDVAKQLHELRNITDPLSADEQASLKMYVGYFNDVKSETYLPAIAEMLVRLKELALAENGNRAAALACLRYVIKQDDAVPDTLGYLGLVDDIQAIEWTLQETEGRRAWAPLLKHFDYHWPSISRVALEENSRIIRLSPYVRTVMGSVLHGFRKEGGRTVLVLPELGPCGLISAFLACVQSISTQAVSGRSIISDLAPGDSILLDGTENAVRAKYAGTLEYGGVSYQSLELKGGGKASVPEHLLARARRSPRPHRLLSTARELKEWKNRHAPSPLFHLVGREFSFDEVTPEVLLVTRRKRLDELVGEIRPMAMTIPELVGIRYVASTGFEENLSGTTLAEPLILCCSDAATALELIRSPSDRFVPRHIVVDEADLAVNLEEGLISGNVPDTTSTVVLAGIQDVEAVRRLDELGYGISLLRSSDVDLVPRHTGSTSDRRDGVVGRFDCRQAIQATATSTIHDIACDAVEFLYEHVRVMRAKIRENDDIQLELIRMSASAFIRKFIRNPLEFDEAEQKEFQALLRNLLQHCATLVDFDTDVTGFAHHVQSMIDEPVPFNPRHAAIRELVSAPENGSIAILCSSAPIAALAEERTADDPLFDRVDWLAIQKLRRSAPFDRLIVPGWIDRRVMREIRNSGYSRQVDLVMYDFEREWETVSRKAGQSWQRRLVKGLGRQWKSFERDFGELPPPVFAGDARIDSPESQADIPDDDPFEHLLETRIVDAIRRATATASVGKAVAKARLVVFEQTGAYVYLPPNGRVISISRALESVSDGSVKNNGQDIEKDAERLMSCPVGEINPGDLLAFPENSGSDLLDELADRFVPNPQETRRRAGLWRAALCEYIRNTQKSVTTVRNELAAAGLVRHPVTVRMWISGSNIVAPMGYSDAISVILEVTGDEELSAHMEDVNSAIDLVYRARTRAAHELLRQLLKKKIRLHEGIATVEIEGHEVRYLLLQVLMIDPPIEVFQDEIGVLKNVSDMRQ